MRLQNCIPPAILVHPRPQPFIAAIRTGTALIEPAVPGQVTTSVTNG